MAKQPVSFHMRPLPDTCVAFASSRGKELFSGALSEGNMDSFFLLSAQFLTQNEPAYCALGTLTMILNAFKVDPQRVWNGPWRWYDQSMLDCCRPLSEVKAIGLTLDEFACLAKCNGLHATLISPDEAKPDLARFRADLKKASKGDVMMAYSYSRASLGQTGSGHFSPIGGYNEQEDMLLVLDVARFKYPPVWIPVKLAYEAMLPVDKATQKPRGYVMLSLLPREDPSSLQARPSKLVLTFNKSTWAATSTAMSRIILGLKSSATGEQILRSLSEFLSTLAVPPVSYRIAQTAHDSLGIEGSRLESILPAERTQIGVLLLALFDSKTASALAKLVPQTARQDVEAIVKEAIDKGGEALRAEVQVIRHQLESLSECCKSESGGSCGCAEVNERKRA